VTGNEDETWLRIVDVPVALAARSYGPSEPVLLAVHDSFLEANSGVYRIADGSAERVGPLGGPVRPELECTVAALAMAYLGDRRPSELVASGWWSAPEPAAVPRADAAFATAGTPWCGTYF
jgi:predicted acetyltransferase